MAELKVRQRPHLQQHLKHDLVIGRYLLQ